MRAGEPLNAPATGATRTPGPSTPENSPVPGVKPQGPEALAVLFPWPSRSPSTCEQFAR